MESANVAYSASQESTVEIVSAIKGDEEFSVEQHREKFAESYAKLCLEQMEMEVKLKAPLEPLAKKRHKIMIAVDGKTSNWLTIMPVACYQFNLYAVEFRDALVIRYGRPLLWIPANSTGQGCTRRYCSYGLLTIGRRTSCDRNR